MPIFKLILHKTYFNQGFFNVIVDFDRYVRKSDGPVRIRLGHSEIEIVGKINRTVNNNGTARVLGGVSLRDWFQNNFEPMETVSVDLSSQDVIVIDKYQTLTVYADNVYADRSHKERPVRAYDRESELRERINTFLRERFGLPQNDYYSCLDQKGLAELKAVLGDINSIFTMKVCLHFGEWLSQALGLDAGALSRVRESILSTPPNANGYDIEISEPIALIAEVKCNIPINGGKVYGSAQRNGIIKDIRSLMEGKSKSRAHPDSCLKFLVLLDLPEIRSATQHLVKNMKEHRDAVVFAERGIKPERKDKLYIVYVSEI
jgi:hypothetical protein